MMLLDACGVFEAMVATRSELRVLLSSAKIAKRLHDWTQSTDLGG